MSKYENQLYCSALLSVLDERVGAPIVISAKNCNTDGSIDMGQCNIESGCSKVYKLYKFIVSLNLSETTQIVNDKTKRENLLNFLVESFLVKNGTPQFEFYKKRVSVLFDARLLEIVAISSRSNAAQPGVRPGLSPPPGVERTFGGGDFRRERSPNGFGGERSLNSFGDTSTIRPPSGGTNTISFGEPGGRYTGGFGGGGRGALGY